MYGSSPDTELCMVSPDTPNYVWCPPNLVSPEPNGFLPLEAERIWPPQAQYLPPFVNPKTGSNSFDKPKTESDPLDPLDESDPLD